MRQNNHLFPSETVAKLSMSCHLTQQTQIHLHGRLVVKQSKKLTYEKNNKKRNKVTKNTAKDLLKKPLPQDNIYDCGLPREMDGEYKCRSVSKSGIPGTNYGHPVRFNTDIVLHTVRTGLNHPFFECQVFVSIRVTRFPVGKGQTKARLELGVSSSLEAYFYHEIIEYRSIQVTRFRFLLKRG
ncbi:hypothetical protein NPIL_228591 [Nephila pilipes]|uniref:Uncharacterized protein n=1 Tax=Nephila pilipes TaxID=299642 RepID=A0A8X6PIU7_NEPPI|nr:hypothetical protein NPIL_228591 [Nephila pilipes]